MIKTLRLKGFRRYVDDTIAFEPGVCFVAGRNNAGKTSLFLAIEYALFGSTRPLALMRPGASSMGVELVFVGRDQKTYKLQRVHAKPPKAKTRVVGHFTLKEVAGEGERYLSSSDFQDHEADLAKKLAEITGMSRRAFELAVHVKQGEIASILDGDSKLDIVLGITAAAVANEEMRALALLDEKAADALPALLASKQHIADEKKAAAVGETALTAEVERTQKALVENRAKTKAGDDSALQAALKQVNAIAGAVDAFVDARDALADAEAELKERIDEHGAVDALENRMAAVDAKRAALKGFDAVDARGDLRGRIRRAESELASGAATCHCCGAPIERAKLEKFLGEWKAELAQVDEKVTAMRALDDDARAIESAKSMLAASLAEVEQAKKELAEAERDARAAVGDDEKRDPVDVLADKRAKLDELRMKHAAERAKAEAVVEAAEAALDAAESRLAEHRERAARIEREEARLITAVDALEKRAARAEELRALAGAFKALQEELREKAAHDLATATLRIHRALSVDDELQSVRIDSARYQVLVTARDHDVEVPATLAQGGGHRLLLGLAFRLALVERLGPFPFVLLDEPTYGLDERNRAALLERIAALKLSPQIVLITHQPMGDVPGHRITIERPAGEVAA